ncbi:uncharacterized protein LOC115883424 isoform X2 [Sitophilus oryzae]|uniref:Uncharacterized protein LOC115883424 isoform X2 n=1 Tax=Sitophilus oryzae TaxID=7048 RepID=A0A6J2Y3Y4_SITOR|nr:uncharacterized protein LOC115883424 isoform X2 [Sitophilus oryzae]
MNSTELTEVCRLCPSTHGLLNIFDGGLSATYNMREVILITTGIEISETDMVSKSICEKCFNITLKMFQFRQDALKQDRELKEKCVRLLVKGIKLPNTCITIKKERTEPKALGRQMKQELMSPPLPKSEIFSDLKRKRELHSSVADIYKTYPHLKLPKKCFADHMAPVVSLAMGQVEQYFRSAKLDMRKFIYRPRSKVNNMAKKRTTVLKQKTVTPLKISKKLFEINDGDNRRNSCSDYVCSSVDKNKKKRSLSEENDHLAPPNKEKRCSDQVIDKVGSEHVDAVTETRAQVENVIKETELLQPVIPLKSVEQPAEVMSEVAVISSPEGSDTSNRFTTAASTAKPDFIESLGLTPTVTTLKSQTLHICSVCGSVHSTVFDLKRHSRKHMVCQFCKLKFKTLESKQNHIDQECHMKRIMNAGVVVRIEKIDFNRKVREKYKNAFMDFPPLMPLEREELEINLVEQTTEEPKEPEQALQPSEEAPALEQQDKDASVDVIVLSDEETSVQPVTHPNIAAATENFVQNSSVVRPDVRIKNNSLLNFLAPNVTDVKLVKNLIDLTKSQCVESKEKTVQTDLPSNKNVIIHNSEGTCSFKNLKEQLKVYKVPVSIHNGSFSISYMFKPIEIPRRKMASWDQLPVNDVDDIGMIPITAQVNTQLTPVTTNNDPNISGAVQNPAMPHQQNIVSQNTSFLTNTVVHIMPSLLPVATSTHNQNPAPVIQQLSFSVVPPFSPGQETIKNSTSISSTSVNSNNTTNSLSTSSNSTVGVKSASLNTTKNRNRSPLTFKKPSNSRTAVRTPPRANNVIPDANSKFRVKNVWELQ